MSDIINAIKERAIELNLKPEQKFKFTVAPDVMDQILKAADKNGTKYQRLLDGNYSFFLNGPGKWSSKIFISDTLKPGQFTIVLINTE